MSNFKSLVSGVGNLSKTTKYYDDWSEKYDETLKLWNYQAPKKSIKFLKETTNFKPNNIFSLSFRSKLSVPCLHCLCTWNTVRPRPLCVNCIFCHDIFLKSF